ncbi:CAP domain-containing protein [Streptomyces sp. NRRL S-31]|uniref:CAP domain-containing protein n=1 Tax=Streptomyces sp. NRRL S-31 TaxID=1463898 RepID=UPI0007C75D47|nr:CAP domain-containing protein [Streptomyces sp. NRRL S-31]
MRNATTTRLRCLCAAACAAPLLFGGAAGAAAATAVAPAASPSEILQLVNAERQKAGCQALSENGQLTKAAQVFAEDASKNHLTNHTGSDGSSYSQRIKDAGYTGARAEAENMAWGSTDANTIVSGWMKSAGHHRNIVDCDFKDTGVAVSGDYAVQVFATPG